MSDDRGRRRERRDDTRTPKTETERSPRTDTSKDETETDTSRTQTSKSDTERRSPRRRSPPKREERRRSPPKREERRSPPRKREEERPQQRRSPKRRDDPPPQRERWSPRRCETRSTTDTRRTHTTTDDRSTTNETTDCDPCHRDDDCHECQDADFGEARKWELTFQTHLVFEQEVRSSPPVAIPLHMRPSGIRGRFLITFAEDLTWACFRLFVEQGKCAPTNELVTQAHIHLAPAGQNGSVIVTLFHHSGTNQRGIRADGLLSEGKIWNSEIVPATFGAVRVNTVASLYDALRQGLLYVNVHGSSVDTSQVSWADGIVRGQLFSAH